MKGFGKVQANAHWHGGVPICTTFSERQLLLSQQWPQDNDFKSDSPPKILSVSQVLSPRQLATLSPCTAVTHCVVIAAWSNQPRRAGVDAQARHLVALLVQLQGRDAVLSTWVQHVHTPVGVSNEDSLQVSAHVNAVDHFPLLLSCVPGATPGRHTEVSDCAARAPWEAAAWVATKACPWAEVAWLADTSWQCKIVGWGVGSGA